MVASILFPVPFTQVERFLALSVQVRWRYQMLFSRLYFVLKEYPKQ